MRGFALAAAIVAAVSSPAAARDQSEPAIAREPDARNVAMTPLNDLNLQRDEIPSVLLAAVSDPYASAALSDCNAIGAAIAQLDAALGPDMDVSTAPSDRLSAGRVAKSVVASFIPFRGVLREVTGAAEQERELRAAIFAGGVRRGFLKGLGQQRGCAYPARPAFARVTEAAAAKPRAGMRRSRANKELAVSGSQPAYVSQPVVQALPQR